VRIARKVIDTVWIFAIGACVLATVSGVQVALKTHEMRSSFVRLSDIQRWHDEFLEEYSRLLLERGTLSSYQNVDELAEGALSMHFPEEVIRIQR
jgi:cell division protein FtsL